MESRLAMVESHPLRVFGFRATVFAFPERPL